MKKFLLSFILLLVLFSNKAFTFKNNKPAERLSGFKITNKNSAKRFTIFKIVKLGGKRRGENFIEEQKSSPSQQENGPYGIHVPRGKSFEINLVHGINYKISLWLDGLNYVFNLKLPEWKVDDFSKGVYDNIELVLKKRILSNNKGVLYKKAIETHNFKLEDIMLKIDVSEIK